MNKTLKNIVRAGVITVAIWGGVKLNDPYTYKAAIYYKNYLKNNHLADEPKLLIDTKEQMALALDELVEGEKPLLKTAKWCPPCNRLKTYMNDHELRDSVNYLHVDTRPQGSYAAYLVAKQRMDFPTQIPLLVVNTNGNYAFYSGFNQDNKMIDVVTGEQKDPIEILKK